jgi:uncharacterized membrane protein YfcA
VFTGLYLFSQLDMHLITKGLGVFVIAYAIYALRTAARPPGEPRRIPLPLAATLGTSGAFFSVFGGAAGPFLAVYLNAMRIPRDAFRTTITTVLLVILVLRVCGYAGLGLFKTEALLALGLALPLMLIGSKLGDVVANRVDQQTFNRIVGAVLLVSGIVLALKA